ncbi:complement component C8 gamma chain [Periophthalmus magnuspinnatus]|uniref:complement component C8 gamma chain n=1 Tax=Periophthalmus magnuspinnatus TaxID=409849 RepID=UPI00145BE8AE|nr:complement component C8 gamma chain [Periophthalmus magnuspinnatus]
MAKRWWYRLVVVLLMLWVLSEVGEGQMSRARPQRPKKKKNPEDEEIPVPQEINIDINQMLGKWYLLNMASKCSHLLTHGHNAEATTVTLDLTTFGKEQKLSVKTTTRHNHQCWEIHQHYDFTSNSGFFTLKGNNPKNDIKVTILDTDYISYAILVYEVQMSKVRKTTMKLFARSVERLHEPTLLKFETTAATRNFGLAYMFPFPTYSYCDTVDEEHIINCIPTC